MTTGSRLHEIVANANDLAASTKASYLRDLNQWIAFAGSEPTGWTRKRAAAFYAELLKKMRPQSANRLMASVAYASRWYAHFENNSTLDFALVQNAKAKDKKPQQALDESSLRALLATCDHQIAGIRDFALMVVGVETGMRRISIIGMRLEDVVLQPSERWPYPAALVPLKGRDPAWVPLSDTAVVALSPWVRNIAGSAGPVFRPLRRQYGQLTPDAKELSRSALAKMLLERARQAKIRPVNPHLFRHTFVTDRTTRKFAPHEIAAVTHHDVTKALGALGGYMDMRELGGRIRNSTPTWLAELVARRME